MKTNVGTIDKTVRLVAAAIVAGLIFSGQVSGTLAIVLGILAGIFVLTSIVSFCPLYVLLKISTKKQDQSLKASQAHS